MPQDSDRISREQLTAVAFVMLLSPMFRRIPGQLVDLSGRAGWVSILLAAAPLLGLLFLYAAVSRRLGGKSGESLVLEALGRPLGRVFLGLLGLWLVFYCGFLLCSSADRLLTTVFPESRPDFFILSLLAVCHVAVLGELRALARSAMVFRPVLVLVLVFVFAPALPEIDTDELFPVWSQGALPVYKGALMVLNTFSLPLLILFWEERSTGPFRSGPFVGWCVTAVLTAFFSCLICLGLLGQSLVQSISHPFFAVIRDLSVFSVLERMEALVLGLWVFSDFLLISLLLKTAAKLLSGSLGLGEIVCRGDLFFQLSGRRWLLWLCSLGAGAAAELLSPNVYRLAWFSKRLIPAVHFFLILTGLPLCFLIWWLKSRKGTK